MKYTKTLKLLIAACLSVFPALVTAQSQHDGFQVALPVSNSWLRTDEALSGLHVDFSNAGEPALKSTQATVAVNNVQMATEVHAALTSILSNTQSQVIPISNDIKMEGALSGVSELLGKNVNGVPGFKAYLDSVDKQQIIADGRGTVLNAEKYWLAASSAIQQLESFMKPLKPAGQERSMLEYVDGRGTVLTPQHLLAENVWIQDLKIETFHE